MDLEIQGSLRDVSDILTELGFEVIVKKEKLEAKLKQRGGKFHVLGAQLKDGVIYLDVHWDAHLHLLFIGVDYQAKPRKICEAIIERAAQKGLKAEIIGGTNWFNRRNKAILKGLKI